MSNAEADLGSESGDLDTDGNNGNGNGNGNNYGDVKIVRIKKINFVSMAKELMFVAPMNTLNDAQADSEFDSFSEIVIKEVNIRKLNIFRKA